MHITDEAQKDAQVNVYVPKTSNTESAPVKFATETGKV